MFNNSRIGVLEVLLCQHHHRPPLVTPRCHGVAPSGSSFTFVIRSSRVMVANPTRYRIHVTKNGTGNPLMVICGLKCDIYMRNWRVKLAIKCIMRDYYAIHLQSTRPPGWCSDWICQNRGADAFQFYSAAFFVGPHLLLARLCSVNAIKCPGSAKCSFGALF